MLEANYLGLAREARRSVVGRQFHQEVQSDPQCHAHFYFVQKASGVACDSVVAIHWGKNIRLALPALDCYILLIR